MGRFESDAPCAAVGEVSDWGTLTNLGVIMTTSVTIWRRGPSSGVPRRSAHSMSTCRRGALFPSSVSGFSSLHCELTGPRRNPFGTAPQTRLGAVVRDGARPPQRIGRLRAWFVMDGEQRRAVRLEPAWRRGSLAPSERAAENGSTRREHACRRTSRARGGAQIRAQISVPLMPSTGMIWTQTRSVAGSNRTPLARPQVLIPGRQLRAPVTSAPRPDARSVKLTDAR